MSRGTRRSAVPCAVRPNSAAIFRYRLKRVGDGSPAMGAVPTAATERHPRRGRGRRDRQRRTSPPSSSSEAHGGSRSKLLQLELELEQLRRLAPAASLRLGLRGRRPSAAHIPRLPPPPCLATGGIHEHQLFFDSNAALSHFPTMSAECFAAKPATGTRVIAGKPVAAPEQLVTQRSGLVRLPVGAAPLQFGHHEVSEVGIGRRASPRARD